MSESDVTKLQIQNTRYRALLAEARKQLVRAQRERLQAAQDCDMLRQQIDDALNTQKGE